MECISKRVSGVHLLGPMSALETRDYLHLKLTAAGSESPAEIFPDAVCADVYSASNGWPGVCRPAGVAGICQGHDLPGAQRPRQTTGCRCRRGPCTGAVCNGRGRRRPSAYLPDPKRQNAGRDLAGTTAAPDRAFRAQRPQDQQQFHQPASRDVRAPRFGNAADGPEQHQWHVRQFQARFPTT